jgi:type I restriction-modification system DNA methylase subunit/restriction endonuclease S subunit/uncharacterized C2H2 Zn-finger protein
MSYTSIMTKEYNCDLCKKVFNQKIDFTRHTNKKTSCISIDKMQSLAQTKDVKTEYKTNLSTIFNYCLDVLRNNEHLTGDKALRTLAHLLDLRLLEPQFGQQIDIDDYAYDFSAYDDDIADQHKAKLLKLVRFSNLAKEKEDNIPKIMKCLWDEILSVHPITKNIFLKGKGFDIQHQSTYKKLIDKLYTFDFEAVDEDILGEAYEEVIKDVMIGKTLGQFFTPPKVKQMMVNLIDPQLKPDGTIETIFDPAMGTGGFLITCLRNLLKKSKGQNIPLNWDFISQQGLGGREAEPDTYQLAVSNMLIASGKMFKVLEKGDSIRDPITNKYDIILANPPFGIDGLTYTEIMHPLRNEYMPISSNSAVPLFLQAIIHMLKINGRCAMVLPEGQELFSKSKALVAVREYLMKTCDLKEVIYLPAGTFTHTTIKTCVFYFHKKKEGNDILETKLKYSKTTQKETERTYVFSKTHQTHNVKFYDYNTENETKHLLLEVTIDDIAKNNYSLNYAEYLKDETADEVYEDGVVVKTLGEVCKDISTNKNIPSSERNDGDYRFFTCSREYTSHEEYHYEGTYIIHGSRGSTITESVFMTENEKFAIGTSMFISEVINKKEVLTKYVYYYLKFNTIVIDKYINGTAIPMISKANYYNIKIPIPPLDRQQEIVKYLDFIYEKCIKTSTEKILELKQLNEFCLNTQKVFGENSVKMLGEVCESIKTGKNKPKDNKTGTLYPYYGTGSITGYTDEFLYDGKYILTARNGTIGNCFLTDGKFFPSDHIFVIDIKDKCLMKYVYYILSNNEKLNQLKTGVGIPNITKGTLETLKIHIPSLERQKEIVEYCEFNDRLIQQLEKEVEQNKKQANMFISGIVKTAGDVAPVENELGEEASPTPIVEEVSNVEEEEAVAVVKEAPNPKKLVKKIKLKVAAASEE